MSRETGDVFVVEGQLGEVEMFSPKKNGSGETIGVEEPPKILTVSQPVAVAVDNSALPSSSDPSVGDVYVASTKGFIFKFNAAGTQIEKIKGLGPIVGIAVNASGHVFASEADGEIVELNDAAANAILTHIETPLVPENTTPRARRGLALDSHGDFYIGSDGFSAEGAENALLAQRREEFTELNYDSEYGGNGDESAYAVVAKLNSTGAILVPALEPEPTGGFAVDLNGAEGNTGERDDVYALDLVGAAGEKTTTVSELAPPVNENETGQLLQRFAIPGETNGFSEGVGIALDEATGELYVLDAVTTSVDVYRFAPQHKPSVTGLSAQSSPSSPGTWTLGAEVDAGGAPTSYHFESGSGSCAPPASSCSATPSVEVGSAYGPQAVTQPLSGLAPGFYHYRVVAESTLGAASAEGSFTIDAPLGGLPDGRQWELVSSPDKDGSELEAITLEGGLIQAAEDGEAITYVSSGQFAGQEPEGTQAPIPTQQLSVRGPSGWSSTDINTAAVANGIETGYAREYRDFSPNLSVALVQPYTSSLSPLANPPLAASETKQKTIYLRGDPPLAPEPPVEAAFAQTQKNATTNGNAGFLALVNNTNENIFGPGEQQFGGPAKVGLEFEGASKDLNAVAFRSETDAPGLYEWVGPQHELQRVGVLPNGVTEPDARLGLVGVGTRRGTENAISADGSHVVWSPEKVRDLYVRDTETQETVQLDAFESPALKVANGTIGPGADFVAASANGSRVFFTDTQRLTSNSHATEKSPDLYVYEFNPLKATLRDLTPQPGADVLVESYDEGNGVLGIDEEGTYVYFVANGALTPDASPGGCPNKESPRPAGTTCNVYVSHLEGSEWHTRLIAAISAEDSPDWGEGGGAGLQHLTSRVAPNGQYVSFMSNRNLTGYEPVEAGKPNRDEEVYMYSYESGRLVCASCVSSGAPPVGVEDPGGIASAETIEGIGLLVDRPQTWLSPRDIWLAGSVPGWTAIGNTQALYQSRYLTSNGRLFFTSPDDLVPGATGQKEMVYEYEVRGQGSCENEGGCVALVSGGSSGREQAFVDASASGNDVFFLSAAELTPNPENSHSLYDAHVCEASSPCTSSSDTSTQQCDEVALECRPSPGSPPIFGPPASESTSGPGNITPQIGKVEVLPSKVVAKPKPLTRAQKLAAALKACKKDKKKSKQLACERAAHKRFPAPAKKSSVANRKPGVK
ncbi:MAG TPA: hypothetical protein VK721_15645 [Solirubrobacteraceae bacterium]|nr:hypothetical protein [Solirubrobacteraceae bacterium]